jgi:hypothetical protein
MNTLAALAVSAAGCGGSTALENGTGGGTGSQGIVGVWNGSATLGDTSLTEHTTFNADGTALAIDSFAVNGAACTGALDISDRWTSTATTLSVSGGICAGQVQCPSGGPIACGPGETMSQTCTYALSNGGDTLVVTCPNSMGPITFTRQP